MDPSQIEFLAEQEPVTIIPNFNDARTIHLISGDIGPFRAGLPLVVPIWVALNLKKRRKCKIVPPDWMDIERLEEILEEEKNSKFFTKLPSTHYMGMAHLLLEAADEDIRDTDKIRTAIKDIWDLRVSKARSSADTFLKGGGRHAGVDHMTQLEISTLRPLLLDALDTVHRLTSAQEEQSMISSVANTSNSFSWSNSL